ncbi:cytochrome o ubiquinol oxidase subunit I [Candidatus Saccharibacteria bacterium CG_4_10_14_0_2_um_filter_52_9]|nr:MAG: cytochrome o ubiquinol oxidase subunit I [Candidatus Saccharibacteria bacterium CG_4_10_14_0_2_um_filter_52_9]
MLGKLSLDALNNGPIVLGAQLTMLFGGLGVAGLLTYKRRWKWLWKEWLTSLDPKKIGVMYIIIALVMLLRGAADAGMMRAQQALSAGEIHGFLTSDHFQQIFSAHGTIMIFFVAMGLMFGLINLIVPLQIGARDVAFPFLNSVSFWLFAAGMILINLSLAVGEFSAAGWLAYPPLSELAYSPGVGVDYWIWALQIAGIGSLLAGINFVVTILRMRAPGMTLMKMPMFTWSVLCSLILVIFAFPILTATLAMLALDRTMGMHIFTAGGGGDAMMYVNLIWAWGHPEVYILILPAFGVFSEVVATFSRKRLFGYASMVAALIAITFLSFVVWLHHFFTMGAGGNVNAFFGIMTMVIAIPTGVKIFNWLFTMKNGRVRFTTPMLWFLAFVVTFSIGGMTGVMMAVPAIDFQVHNSLFLVAHFHTMIIGGVVFGFFAGLTYWFPKIFGFRLNERLGRYAFWCWFVGFLLAFIPLYILGLMGATRRLDHYDASLGWQGLFIVAGIGAMTIFAGVGFQILQLIVSIRKRHENMDTTGDPWNGRTLEWSTTSPAPFYNFAVIPDVSERDAFWVAKHKKTSVTPVYEDIYLPKNSGMGLFIAGFAFIGSFAIIWHIWWLAPLGLLGVIACVLIRTTGGEHEYRISAARVAMLEADRLAGKETS